MQTRTKLSGFKLKGFKSIRSLPDGLTFGSSNILIGANGAGKSNFISFFKLLSWLSGTEDGLSQFVARSGGANSLLHDGAETTERIEAELRLETETGFNDYYLRLFYAAQDTLVFAEERFRFSNYAIGGEAPWRSLGAGHKGSGLHLAELQDQTARVLLRLLQQCKVYQFHNTSETARIRQKWAITDGRWLREDGANLAPFLLRLRESAPKAYRRIVETLRQVLPFFDDFVLAPEYERLLLQWRERGTDVLFGVHQASDGMLRAMALIALLLQPIEDLPALLILDEPELGLHPHAINILAGLLQSVSVNAQVFVATQSMTLLDYFTPEDVIVVDRINRESVLRRLNTEQLAEWLEEYSLAELLEKNVIGGTPR